MAWHSHCTRRHQPAVAFAVHPALVAQGIEHRPPEPCAQVRILPRARTQTAVNIKRVSSFSIAAIQYSLGDKRIFLPDAFPDAHKTLEKTKTVWVYESKQTAGDLALVAARNALEKCKWGSDSIDALICVTQSHVNVLPGLSFHLQDGLALPTSILRLDLSDGCSGFVQALHLSSLLPESYKRVLIVCTDTYRQKLRPGDSSTELLFSDGASAVAIERPGDFEIAGFASYSSGKDANCLHQSVGDPSSNHLSMVGYQVFSLVKKVVIPQVDEVLTLAGVPRNKVRNFFFHQGSGLVMETLAASLGRDSLPSNLAERGNLVSSSIPVLLADLDAYGDLENTLVSGFGVGFHCCGVFIRSTR